MVQKLTNDERARIAEKLMEWGNLVFVGLVVAQIIGERTIHLNAAIAGVFVFLGTYYLGVQIMKRR